MCFPIVCSLFSLCVCVLRSMTVQHVVICLVPGCGTSFIKYRSIRHPIWGRRTFAKKASDSIYQPQQDSKLCLLFSERECVCVCGAAPLPLYLSDNSLKWDFCIWLMECRKETRDGVRDEKSPEGTEYSGLRCVYIVVDMSKNCIYI